MTIATRCDDWLKSLDSSQRFVVELAQSTYDLTLVEVMEYIEAGLLRWKRIWNEPDECEYWTLMEAE